MRKVVVITLSLVLFFVAYQVRFAFFATHEYNETSDTDEYILAINGARELFTDLPHIKNNIGALNTHGTPLYISYLTILSNFSITHVSDSIFFHSLLVVIIFLVAQLFLPFWISLIVAAVSIIYTPLFAFLYSYMPESFTGWAVPVFLLCAMLFAINGRKKWHFVVAGLFLASIGLSRHVFTWYGLFFIALWFLMTKPKKSLAFSFLLAYLIPTIIWFMLVKWSGIAPYDKGVVEDTFFQAHRTETDGWRMDSTGFSWPSIFLHILLQQNFFDNILLQLERITRLLKNPANSYAASFPLSQGALVILHMFISFFAALGLRQALKNKYILFIASLIVWNTLFVSLYYLEEIRYQIPVLALMLLLAGAGIVEIQQLLKKRQSRFGVLSVFLLFLIWWAFGKYIIGIEMWFFPFIVDSNALKIINILVAASVMIFATYSFWIVDKGNKVLFFKKHASKIVSFIPLGIFIIILSVYLRSKIWHGWSTPLPTGAQIQQKIAISSQSMQSLQDKKGFILIDLQDSNSAQFIQVSMNGRKLRERLGMSQKISNIDLMAIRQWQRTLPRLGGFLKVEDSLASAAAWPNLHDWLVIPISGISLLDKNIITVENTSMHASQFPYLFGDYLAKGSGSFYEGPSVRIFSATKTHNKYQVDGDMRLTERISLDSIYNKSSFIYKEKMNDQDLSVMPGVQNGRYRIFLLFFTDDKQEMVF